MAVTLYTRTAFDVFQREGDIIGRLVVEYGELEWSLCLLTTHVVKDTDLAIKALYRARGETQRINLADALIRNRIDPKLKPVYEQTVARLRTCMTIRNRYAHSNWVRAGGDRLCYVDIEELANRNDAVDLSKMPIYQLDMYTITDQVRLFSQVSINLNYLCMEVQHVNASTESPGYHYIKNIEPPIMAKRLD